MIETSHSLQINHIATSLLALLLLPALIRTGKENSTNSRLVVVSSDTHMWTKLDEELLDSPNIIKKLSDEEYCREPTVMLNRYPDTKRKSYQC